MQLSCLLPSLFLLCSLSSAVPLPQEEALLGAEIDISNLENIGDITFDNIGSVLDILIKSGGTVQNVISQFQNINNNGIVKELVEEAKDIIERLKQGISEINEQHKTYAGEALKEMVFIKIQLKASRLSLNDLAKRTVFAVEDLKAFSKAFFDKNEEEVEEIVNAVDLRSGERMEYVKEQITVMKDLIEDTKKKVDEVKTIYADVRVRMTKVEENLIMYKLTVEHLLRNETSDSGSVSSNARAGVYTTAGVTTTACIVADILGALGICSAINLAVTATSAITLEVALAEMRANLKILHHDGEMVIKDVQELMVNQDYVEDYLDKEEEMLVFWVAALQTVERKIQNTDRLFLQTLPVLRERYLASLDSLGNAAQEYLDQQEL